MESARGDRVVDLLRRLEGEAEQWGRERDFSAAQCTKWSSALTAPSARAAGDGATGSPALAERCTELLREAGLQDRRAAAASRGAKAAESAVAKAEAKRAEVGQTHVQAMSAVQVRTQTARRQLEEVLADRAQLLGAQRARVAAREARHDEEVEAVEEQIRGVRRSADDRAKEGRQQMAEQRARRETTVASLQADFRARCEELEAGMARYSSECERAVEAAARRVREAGLASEDARRLCSEHQASVRQEADEHVRLHCAQRQACTADVDVMLCEHEEALSLKLLGSTGREVAFLTDRSAEEHVKSEVQAVDARIARLREECDELCQRRWLEAKALFDEVSEAGRATAARIAESQEGADRAVVASLPEARDAEGDDSHEGQIAQLQVRLATAVAAMRRGFAERLGGLREASELQRRQAGAALVAADKRVEELRSEAAAKTEARVREAEAAVQRCRAERVQVSGEAAENLQCTRSQMVQYLETREDDLRTTLADLGGESGASGPPLAGTEVPGVGMAAVAAPEAPSFTAALAAPVG